MKKNFLFFVLFFILLFSCSNGVKAYQITESFTDYYFYRRGGNDKPHSGELYTYKIDGDTTYCIEPGITINKESDYLKETTSPYDEELTRKINLIAYYGYDYPNHQTLRYKMATQLMIWEAIGGQQNEVWTEIGGGGKFIDLKDERDEINRLINQHGLKPSFDLTRHKIIVGEELVLTDENNVLSNFRILYQLNSQSRIEGNNLYIKFNSKEDLTFNLVNNSYTDKYTKFYYADGSQKQAYFGISDLTNVYVNIFLEVVYGEVEVTKTNQKGEKISNVVFGIYNEANEEVCRITTDEYGYGKCDNLTYGSYTMKEISCPEGYKISDKIYSFNINSSTPKISYDISNKLIEGTIEIYKTDSETGNISQGDATLKGAIYGIYNMNGEKISELITDENGYAKSILLPYGKYIVKEIKPSEGYKIDNSEYTIFIQHENEVLKVLSKEPVIKYKFSLLKTEGDGKSGIVEIEPNAEFNIYLAKNNKLIGKMITDQNGKASITLPYGTYQVCQIKGSEFTNNAACFTINIKSNDIEKVINNELIKARLKIIKIDSITKKNIPLKGIKFKIKNLKTNEYVCQQLTYPNLENICIYETDINGYLYTPYELTGGIYQLEEIDQKITGYLWNKEPLKFEISKNSKLENVDGLGTILELKFANKEVKGNIIIEKLGEELNLGNNTYSYLDIPLDNVIFELYAKEDIYSGDHTLIYKKDTLINTYQTINGKIAINDLYLGNYYLIEKETPDGYLLDKNKYDINLSYQDQYTEIVNVNINIKNYLKKGKLIFNKKNNSNSPLPNAKIAIYKYTTDENEATLIYEGKTDELGNITLNNLIIGKYFLEEIEAPEGYLLNNTRLYFDINNENDEINLELINEPIQNKDFTFDVPNTKSYDLNMIVLLILIILGICFYEKKEN